MVIELKCLYKGMQRTVAFSLLRMIVDIWISMFESTSPI